MSNSATTRNRDPCRDRQPGFRHGRAGSDADISLEEGGTVPGSRMKNSTALPSTARLYVIGGWGDGKARGVNYEYDPATDKWTKKKSMPRPAHHAALAATTARST